jgi:hypothetical protein
MAKGNPTPYLMELPTFRRSLGLAIIFLSVLATIVPLKGMGLAAILCLLSLSLVFFRWPHSCLMTFGIFVLLQDLIIENVGGQTAIMGGAIKNLDEVIILWCFVLLLFSHLSRGSMLNRTPLEVPILGIVIMGVLSSVASEVPPFIAASQFFLLIKGFLVFYILANLHINEMQLRKYLWFFCAAACIILALGLVDLAFPTWFRSITGNTTYIDWRAGMPSVKSIFIHPNVFGWFMTFMALYLFAFYLIFRKLRYLIFGLFFSVGSFLSMRRKPLGGMVAGLFSGLWQQPLTKKVRYGVIFGLIGTILFISAWPKIKELHQHMVALYVKERFVQARNILYLKSIAIAKDYFPLGAGLGRYGSWMSRVHYSPLYKKYSLSKIEGLSQDKPNFINDTFWPMILGELGIIGLLFYLWICGRLLILAWQAQKILKSPLKRAFALGTFMVFIEGLVESLASPVLVTGPQTYFLFGAMGVLYSLIIRR